jgi:5-formyltetrahydrofolate cyclo-ligase
VGAFFPGPYTDLHGSCPCLEPWFLTHGAHLLNVGPGIARLTAKAARHLHSGAIIFPDTLTPVTAPLQDLEAQKRAARSRALKLRTSLHEVHKSEAPLTLARAGLEFTGLRPGPTVSGFFPYKSEIDTLPLLARLDSEGWITCLPIVEAERQPLKFRQWAPGEPTVAGIWGIPMPLESALQVEPDVLLVPMLAFDRAGYRLGYGGGFYDRTLAFLRQKKHITAIGVGYSGQEIDSVPKGIMDQPLDYILTETGSRKCG